MASGARVLCLDEPTAGIAQRETEAFGPLMLRIRDELHASLLVIEHDMPVIMGISDRVYCLEAGQDVERRRARRVRNDPRVIASVPRDRRTGDPAQRRRTDRVTASATAREKSR